MVCPEPLALFLMKPQNELPTHCSRAEHNFLIGLCKALDRMPQRYLKHNEVCENCTGLHLSCRLEGMLCSEGLHHFFISISFLVS